MAVDDSKRPTRACDRPLPARVSPYKIRQVLDLVRGLPVDDAIRVLQLARRTRPTDILKLLDSAIANAEHNHAAPRRRAVPRGGVVRRGPDPQVGSGARPRPLLPCAQAHRRTSRSSSPASTPTSSSAAPRATSRAVAARRPRSAGAPSACAGRAERRAGRSTTTITITITTTSTPRTTRSTRKRRRPPRRARGRRRARPRPRPKPTRRRSAKPTRMTDDRRRRKPARSKQMGQKVNPYGFRLGITTDWKSRWIADKKEYTEFLIEDWKIRDYLRKQLERAAVSRVEIERTRDRLRIDVHTARPGIVIGRRGAEAERLREGLRKISGNPKIQFNIQEIKQPEIDAMLLAQGIADQLSGPRVVPPGDEARGADRDEGRRARRARAVQRPARRRRDEPQGVVPRRSGAAAHAARRRRLRPRRSAKTLGRIGVKVWIYKGDILPYKSAVEDKIAKEAAMAVGETAGPGRRVVSAGGGRRRPDAARRAAVTTPSTADGDDDDRGRQAAARRGRSRARAPARGGRRDRAPHPRAPRDAALPRGRGLTMLMPRKVRHRKTQRGRMPGSGQRAARGSRSASTGSRRSSRAGSRTVRSKPLVSR